VGEFDFEALFFRGLAYEREVFALLEQRLDQYDAIVEIGANVGVYTAYFAKACTEGQSIFAFEPSRKAFARLKENLALNGGARVQPFNMAVTDKPGLVSFFEPAGHLTNGSLKRDFAAFFSENVQTSTVEAVDGTFLAKLLAPYRRPLLKIDVEGAEAEVLRGLAPLIGAVRPDLIIEVLNDYESALNALDFVTGPYRLLNITSDGLREKSHFEADGQYRDYLLVPRQATES
jgi:FkbM family methyltransferase